MTLRPHIGSLIRTRDNPELGPGRVVAYSAGNIEVSLLWEGTRRIFNTRNLTIERYMLFGNVPVAIHINGSSESFHGVIIGTEEAPEEGLWVYRVATVVDDNWEAVTASEADLHPLPPSSLDPLDQFKTLSWRGPARFVRRWTLRSCQSRWLQDSGGIPAFLGARIRPMGHQLYAARRVLWDRTPRFVLADEVGLGKTIEAGLVIQSLMAEKPDLRVLVITPGSMARQWQTELYLRFGALAYRYVDSATLTGLTPKAARSALRGPRLVTTTTALQTAPQATEALITSDWDLLVVDEAHQFPPGSILFDVLFQLAKRTHAVLALSATPSKRELTSLAGLLALVAPDVYAPTDLEALTRRLDAQRDVWDRLSFTRKALEAAERSGEELDAEDLAYLAEQWQDLVPGDPSVHRFVGELASGDVGAADRLIAYVQEFHRLDHRIIRTRRSTIASSHQHWSDRQVEVLEFEGTTAEAVLANHLDELATADSLAEQQWLLRGLYLRMSLTTPSVFGRFLESRRGVIDRGVASATSSTWLDLMSTDPGPVEEALLIDRVVATTPMLPDESAWLDVAIGLVHEWAQEGQVTERTRHALLWIERHLLDSSENQVLVFAQDREVVVELAVALHRLLPDFPVLKFEHGMEDEELSRVSLKFQRNDGCRVLVSDELGGEGRNFQNATAVLHFDVPWSVARLEQRVGRLDRVGRGKHRPVLSIVMQGPFPIEGSLVAVHREVFKVFTRSVGGLEYALPRLQRELSNAICAGADRVDAVAARLAEEVNAELRDVDEAFELALDASRYQLADAQEVADIVAESDESRFEVAKFAQWAREIGIRTTHRPDGSWEFSWQEDALARPVHGLRSNGFLTGTFGREAALADDSLQFLAPGHSLINALMGDIEASGEGRATVLTAELGPRARGRKFMLFVGHCHLDSALLRGVDASPGLRLRAHRYLAPEVWTTMVELFPGEEPAARPLQSAEVLAQFRSPENIKVKMQKVPPNTLGKAIDLTELWASVEEGIPIGIDLIRTQREGIPEEAARQFASELAPELGYLAWQCEQAGAPERRALEAEIHARRKYVEAIRNERIDVEAIAVMVAVG